MGSIGASVGFVFGKYDGYEVGPRVGLMVEGPRVGEAIGRLEGLRVVGEDVGTKLT